MRRFARERPSVVGLGHRGARQGQRALIADFLNGLVNDQEAGGRESP